MRKRPRVAVAAPGCGSGGSVGWVAAWHARELGREFETALFSDSPPSGRGPYDFVPVDTPQFRPLRRLSHVPREVAFAAGVGRALLRHYAPGEPMAVVCHGHVLTAVAGRALNRRLGVAVLMVTHGDVFERPRGTYDATLTALYKYASAVAYQDADAVIALSTAMAELAVRGGARPGRVFVVPNGVEPEALGPAWDEPRPRPAATTRLQLLFVGRLAVEKGVEDLIEAVCILEEEGHGVQLQIVGDGPEAAALRKGIRDRFRHLVTFLGARPKHELAQIYRASDVVCVPSRSDSFPGVVLEALACGVPVIGSRVGGIPDVVTEGTNGLLVPPGRPRQLASAIARVAGDKNLLASMEGAARGSVWPRFAWEETGRQLRSVVAGVAGLGPEAGVVGGC